MEGGDQHVYCDKCRGDPDLPCDCACVVCDQKDRPEETLVCDECNYEYHLACLDPPLDAIPEGDWYCPECRNDPSEIVGPGQPPRRRRRSSESSRSPTWGRGMSYVGRSKTCDKVAPNHFGPIPGVEVGMTWAFRIQMCEEGLHRQPVAGIAGKPAEGACSVVMGGYEDDLDLGDTVHYTGSGGREPYNPQRTSKQVSDQTLTRSNLALAASCHAKIDPVLGADAGVPWREGKPVRLIRSYKLRSEFAPKAGYRYDGIYKVTCYRPAQGKSGLRIWKFVLRRDDASPAPWTEGARQFACVYPDGYHDSTVKEEEEEEVAAPLCVSEDKVAAPSVVIKEDEGAASAYVIDEDIRTKIAAEARNKVAWEQVLQSAMVTKLDFVNAVEKAFQCTLCHALVHLPVTTSCGHNFCYECFGTLLETCREGGESSCCPNCRKAISKQEDGWWNTYLSEILFLVFPGYADGRGKGSIGAKGKRSTQKLRPRRGSATEKKI